MDFVELRSETSTVRSVRSEISTASSGFAIVSAPPKKYRAPIPEYEPPPDYSPLSPRKQTHHDVHVVGDHDVTQSLLQHHSTHSEVDSSESTTRDRPQLGIQTDTRTLTIEVCDLIQPSSPSLISPASETSNRTLLRRSDEVKIPKKACSCTKKCLWILISILGTGLILTVLFFVLFFTVCIGGATRACSKD